MSDDVVEFLRARLADDEAEIVKHPDGEDHWDSYDLNATGETNYPCFPYLQIHKERALAEVEMKRRIITEVNSLLPPNLGVDCGQTRVLKALAAPYASHPDYDEAWRQ